MLEASRELTTPDAGRPDGESLLARLSAPLLLARPGMRPVAGLRRLLVPLAAQGFKLHGVDSSAAMLASCEARVAASGIEAPRPKMARPKSGSFWV